jgi:7,8-dihydropterin-6-yl-methyl-4-(beta-D-ribofuranosyl)aminobenzene 5'-phosphate synthase
MDQQPFTAPLVDSLEVRVVVDSRYDLFMADAAHPLLKIEHTRRIHGHERSTLAGEWGLSLHLESARGGERARYLLDFGFTPEVLIRNFDLLGLDPARLDGLILSHGHLDHYGGLTGFVAHHRDRMPADIKLYAGGESYFGEQWLRPKEGGAVSMGRLDRAALDAARVETVCCEEARALAGAFTTGPIARRSFEHVLENTFVTPAEAGAGHFSEAELSGRLVPNQHPDEHATCYVVQGRGLVVISSCGHAGLINTIETAMAVSGVDKLHAVLGGFHLGPAPNDYVEHTVNELARFDPDLVIPMHCSGSKFIAAMQQRMPDRLVASNTGTRFTFGV